jgi:hypothetical protein
MAGATFAPTSSQLISHDFEPDAEGAARSPGLQTCLGGRPSMLIRYGYEIAINCPQPTPMVCLLSVSEDRKADIRVAEKVFTTPKATPSRSAV